jgi:hypothetical protein
MIPLFSDSCRQGWQKTCFFYLKKNIHFFFYFKKFFLFKTCFKPILNTNKTALNRLKSLLCSCTFTLDHWACALRSYIAILQCKLRNYGTLDFLLFSRVISSGIIVVYLTSSCVNWFFFNERFKLDHSYQKKPNLYWKCE